MTDALHRIRSDADAISFWAGIANCTQGCVIQSEPNEPELLELAWATHCRAAGQRSSGGGIGSDHKARSALRVKAMGATW